MKKRISILMICSLILSCGESNQKESELESTTVIKTTDAVKTEIKNNSNSNILCKINGENWAYTSNHGLVSRNSSTNVRTATIGFTKQLEKGYESIQIEYDVDANVVNSVLVELKRPNKQGKLITVFYTQYSTHLDKNPEANLSGTIDLSENDRKASGTGDFTLANKYEKDQLNNAEDLMITISDLKFSDVPYSDTDDLKKLMKK